MTTIKDIRDYLSKWNDDAQVEGDLNIGIKLDGGAVRYFCHIIFTNIDADEYVIDTINAQLSERK